MRTQVQQQESKIYWLHVDEHGVEQRFDEKPANTPTMKVSVVGDFEFTRTSNHESHRGAITHILSIAPRGKGWTLIDSSSDNWSEWRRRTWGR